MSCRIFWGRRKRNALIAVFVLALALTWPVYSLIRQAHRDAAYRTAIAPFQRDLHVGKAEEEVKRYLDWRHVEYHPVRLGGSNGPTYQIGVGEEDSLICERDGYIALEFGNAGGAKRGSRKADSSLP
jgi:hypothetical protein